LLFEFAGLIVALQQSREARLTGAIVVIVAHEISVAMLLAGQSFVEPRKLAGHLVDLVLPDRTVRQVEIPAPRQRRIRAERSAGHIERLSAASVDDQ